MSSFRGMASSIMLWLILLWVQAAVALEASVDRTRLTLGDSLELTLEAAASNAAQAPDLSPLTADFELLETRRQNLISQLDGRPRQVTRWLIRLQPRRSGYLQIPALNLNEQYSDPVTLLVRSAEEAAANPGIELAPVFIDSEVSTETPYVQAEVLLTLRIFHSVSLYDDVSLSGLDIADARVERLGESENYEQVIAGVRHGVIEARYAIYPQVSGPLEIPAQLFSATILVPQRPEQRFSAATGELIQVRSPAIRLDVQGIPDNFPANAQWLPARQLSLQQSWQPDPQQDLLTGEPLTRTLSIAAEGVLASQLPGLNHLGANADPALRLYADQPALNNSFSATGARAERQDSAAIVAQQSGEYLLESITLPWWDTTRDQLAFARLDSQSLRVKSTDSFAAEGPQVAPGAADSPHPVLWPWQLLSLILALALAVTGWLLWRSRQQLQAFDLDEGDADSVNTADGNPLGDLQAACRRNQPADARKALEAWARLQDSEGLLSLTQDHPELASALDQLNASLFGQNPHAWRGKLLWRAVRRVIQEQQANTAEHDNELPPLYPRV